MVHQTTVVSNTQQINEDLFKEFLSKNPVCDFHNISREEYIAKSNSGKESLIIKYYNEMVKGKSFNFYCSCFCSVFDQSKSPYNNEMQLWSF